MSTISKNFAQTNGIKVVKDDTRIKTLNHSSSVIGITEQQKIDVKNHSCHISFYVVESDYDFILGLNWFHAMGAGVAINDGRPVLTFSAESIFLDNPSNDIEIDDDMEEEMFQLCDVSSCF